jgi:hypothetical protein
MRVLACVWCVWAVWIAAAEAAPDFPARSEALERRLLATLDATAQNWVKEQARAMVSAGRISEDRARSVAQGARMASGADVSTMSFLILMQAARDADADLQATMNTSRDQRAEEDELNSMEHNRAPTVSQLSPETQTVLSMKAQTRPVMTLHSTEAPAATGSPIAEADLSVHLDLQTAMDHEAAAEQALSSAAKRLDANSTSSNP